MIKYMAVAVAVAVSGGVAVPVAVPVAGLTKRFFYQKDFLVKNLQTTEKSRGWLEISPFLDQIDRVGAN